MEKLQYQWELGGQGIDTNSNIHKPSMFQYCHEQDYLSRVVFRVGRAWLAFRTDRAGAAFLNSEGSNNHWNLRGFFARGCA